MAADIDPTGSSILRYFTDSYGDIVACYNSCIMQHYVIIVLYYDNKGQLKAILERSIIQSHTESQSTTGTGTL